MKSACSGVARFNRFLSGATACCVAACAGSAQAQHYNDGHGKEWRQLPTTMSLSWDQIDTVCPSEAEGGGPCTGSVSGRDLTGWHWATREEVRTLFSYFHPDILSNPCVGGPQYAAVGIYMLGGGIIAPTFSFYTTFGGSLYVNGWTATRNEAGLAYMSSASGNYPVFDGSLCVSGLQATNTTPNYTGVWLWRSVDCPLPVVTTEPTNVEVCLLESSSAVFTTAATNAVGAQFQWRLDGNAISLASNPSAGTATLTIAAVGPEDLGTYDCVITAACGTVTTLGATLSAGGDDCPVICNDVDFNNDGSFFDPQDIDALLSVYAEGDCIPSTAVCDDIDFNNDTSVFDPCDIDSFLLVFSEGPCTSCGH